MPIPEHPYPGQKWREIRHDNTVTWLAYWKDPISQKDYKYVWLAANSLFKSDSDLAKYEKARKLKVRLAPLHMGARPSVEITVTETARSWAWCLPMWSEPASMQHSPWPAM